MRTGPENSVEVSKDKKLLLALGAVGVGTIGAELAVIGLAGPDLAPVALGIGAGVLVASGIIVDKISQHFQKTPGE